MGAHGEKLNMLAVLQHYDALISQKHLARAGAFLTDSLEKAQQVGDKAAELTLLNELVGYHRRSGDREAALTACDDALRLLKELPLENTVAEGDTCLNCATTRSIYGEDALPLYKQARHAYLHAVPAGDFKWAGFYNNYGLTLAKLGRTGEALTCYEKALRVLKGRDEYLHDAAVTYCSIAEVHLDRGDADKATACLDAAWQKLESPANTRNGAYAFSCEKCVGAFERGGQTERAAALSDRAKEIYERHRTE